MADQKKLELSSLEDLFVEQLQDLYDAEKRQLTLFPKLAAAASASQLQAAFEQHLEETTGQIARLEVAFRDLGKEPRREACEAMKGLIKEAEKLLDACGEEHLKDAALIAAAQRIEHYELAGYGTARSFAAQLSHHETARLLKLTLDEEAAANRSLTKLAETWVNLQAAAS